MNHIRVGDINNKIVFASPNRVLFYGPDIDPMELARMGQHRPGFFSSQDTRLCSDTPFLLAMALALQGRSDEIKNIWPKTISMPNSLAAPFRVFQDNNNGGVAVVKLLFGDVGTGIEYVNRSDLKGPFVINEHGHLMRVLNSAPFSGAGISWYIEDFVGRHSLRGTDEYVGMKAGITRILSDNLKFGQWTHLMLQDQFNQIGVSIPDGHMAFTLNQNNAQLYLKGI